MLNNDLSEELSKSRNQDAIDRFRTRAQAMQTPSLEVVATSFYAQIQLHQKAIELLQKQVDEMRRREAKLIAELAERDDFIRSLLPEP